MQVNAHIIWIPLFIVLVITKLLFGKTSAEQLIISLVFFSTSVYWFIIPFILGRDIQLPSYSDILKKGESDKARIVCFLLGIFGFIVSVLV